MMHAVVVIPTYNERENIERLLTAVLKQQQHCSDTKLSILVVDDSSPDKTAEIVLQKKKTHKNIHLLSGKKEGLGRAYLRGFQYAISIMHADVVFEMDADFSHNPEDLPRLLKEIQKGYDFVIGSRYIPLGSIPDEWGILRKLNSKAGNTLARYMLSMKEINDCTGGFRAIRVSLLRKMHLKSINTDGYAFQISLLSLAKKSKAKIKEIPIRFIDREKGESKIRLSDILEFVLVTITMRFPYLPEATYYISLSLLGFICGIIFLTGMAHHLISLPFFVYGGISLLAMLMVFQSIFALYLMIYSWDQEKQDQLQKPTEFLKPKHTFSLLLPARHEEQVIAQTLSAMARLTYPKHLYEVIVICRADDLPTITAVKKTIAEHKKTQIKLVIFADLPINKPHSLNIGLSHAKNDLVAVFDAEDEPQREILMAMNTLFLKEQLDVIQGGVQLMNYTTSWFATFNVLEYFFWFKSSLSYFAKKGFIPLGGNTVFFKRRVLSAVNGWDEECLTEDAEIGVRLSIQQAKVGVIYDESLTTREETPHSLESFIKQRTRWNQGFIQIFLKGEWRKLNTTTKKLLALYVLAWPLVQAAFFLYLPISFVMMLMIKLPVIVTLLTLLPVYLLILHFITQCIGLFEFTNSYHLPFSVKVLLRSLITFYLYQILLGISSIRAVFRIIKGNSSWEKTLHLNTHRELESFNVMYLPLAKN